MLVFSLVAPHLEFVLGGKQNPSMETCLANRLIFSHGGKC